MLSAERSCFDKVSVNRENNGKINKNSFHLILKSQFYWVEMILLPNLTGIKLARTGNLIYKTEEKA